MAELLQGTVSDAGGPVAQAAVSLLGGPGPLPDIAALTDADGGFRLGVPAAGRYTVVCTAPDGRSARREVTVHAGRGGQVDVELPG
ncbi:carboxypeptidase-like regulatory domain-containing protein [Jannaschia sp. R86511]|uniref:carboxypeptidase-like regulatory domain-containing protein n=1 Tax=Jannaschia sp. R86511 TaxID=3093853 RepID=UPI0036D2ED3E